MGWDILVWGLPAALVLLLVSAGIQDARTREIANWKNAAIALLAPLWWSAVGLSPWPDMAVQLGLALLVFGFFCVAFHFGQMGGGDVKMIGALALWLPPAPLLAMLMIMSVIGGVLTLIMLIEHKFRRGKGVLEIPYGVAIAIAGLISLREPLLNQFT
ncbi:prepilin peptidase [Sphingomonas sp. SUN019]|uniref:A24 family peptidase n=1 Tax=Sphingomonas sp. SUN019 TaxID=2937788 RepID=UPI002164121C|nr:prepilin peptidase [Sphingomonas sp. SUN019]UVO49811.1 prepilin peptidase [Sphingomonas sp. SUN019]